MSDDLVTPLVALPWVSEAALVENMRVAQLCHGREYARDLEAVAGLAAMRQADRPLGGGPGIDGRSLTDEVLAGVREDFVGELALTRGCSEDSARLVLREALLLTGPLVTTWSHLFAGILTVAHAKAVVDLLGDATAAVAAEVQARVLPKAEGLTPAAFRDRLRYHLYRVDAEAKERRRREVLKKIGVFVRRFDEGVSELVIQGPTPAVHAAYDSIDGHARMVRADGDTRPLGVLRAETGLDLLLRPWDTSRPPVTAHLVLHASIRSLRGEGDPAQTQDPGELDGTVVSAAECRDVLRDLDGLDSALIALDDAATGETVAVATRRELATAAGGPGLAPPPDTAAYEPTDAQKRFLGVRDRHCRMPGCRRRPGRARTDFDHDDPYECGGPTACWNLCCLCQRHHRIKTFASGWSFQLLGDGTYVVRTPAGVTRHTRPPGWFPHPEPDPPWLDEQAPPDPLAS